MRTGAMERERAGGKKVRKSRGFRVGIDLTWVHAAHCPDPLQMSQGSEGATVGDEGGGAVQQAKLVPVLVGQQSPTEQDGALPWVFVRERERMHTSPCLCAK